MTRSRSSHRVRPDAPGTTSVPAASGVETARRHRRRRSPTTLFYSAMFTVVQVWALIVLLVHLQPEGVIKVALASVMAAAVIAVITAWQE
ncbi:hypothetical protein [Saccharopolyspora sp. 5N708]|uniref:hypothetical protein n=1 Tax=Saccharopolyspora sp. 5N708 TaxID=3457424 RepID=UPI003FD56BF2